MKVRPPVAGLLLLVAAGCAAPPGADPAHPGQAIGWVETRLSFGLGPADAPSQGMDERRWRAFLDREVAPERLRSRLLVINHPDNATDRDRIEAIRTAWKRLTGDRSVLCVTESARVSF